MPPSAQEPTFNTPLPGKTVESVAVGLLGSELYFQDQGGGTNSGFVTALFEDVLDRAPTAAERTALLQALQRQTRAQVAARLLASPEYFRYVVEEAFEHYLRRAPDPVSLNSLALALARKQITHDGLIAMLVGSQEYLKKVGWTYAGYSGGHKY
jgi:hypothetical protein